MYNLLHPFLLLLFLIPQNSFSQCPTITVDVFSIDTDPTDCETEFMVVFTALGGIFIDDFTLAFNHSGLSNLDVSSGSNVSYFADDSGLSFSSINQGLFSQQLPQITITANHDASEGCILINSFLAEFSTNGQTCPMNVIVPNSLGCPPPTTTVCIEVGYASTPDDCFMTDTDVNSGCSTATTDEAGLACLEVPTGECAEIEIDNCGMCDPAEAINSSDLLDLRKLILGVTLEAPCAYGGLLADVNENNGISTLDLVLIQRHILGLESRGQIGQCVLFNPDDIANGGNLGLDGRVGAVICDGDPSPVELLAGIVGDFNCSCDCEAGENAAINEISNVASINKKDNLSQVFINKDFAFYDLILAFDFTGELDLEQIHLKDFGLEAMVEAHIDDNRLFVTINAENEALELEQGEILFDVYADVQLSNAIEDGISFLIDVETNGFNMNALTDSQGADGNQVSDDWIDVFTLDNAIVFQANESLQGSNIEFFNTAGQQIFVRQTKENNNQITIPMDRKNRILFIRITSEESSFTKSIFH